jgi:hypothetical protein
MARRLVRPYRLGTWVDVHGQAFRYSSVKTGPRGGRVLERVRPGEQRFDIVAVAEALREAGTMVLYGVSGVLDDYSSYQADMRSAAGL